MAKNPLSSLSAALATGALGISLFLGSACGADKHFGQVASKVANLLQREHYNDHAVDDEISAELLENYLEFLDMGRYYFLQSDIDYFRAKYEKKLDDMLLLQNISPAHEIYGIYQQRVIERGKKIKQLLKTGQFTFDSDRAVELSRKEAQWPVDQATADQLWHNLIEGELLAEVLQQEKPEQEEQEEGESGEAPAVKKNEPEESPREIVAKRYERVMESLAENTAEDISGFFLKSLAHSYDPHSEYFTQSEYDNFRISMQKSLDGIGALLSMTDGGYAEIKGLVVNGPAHTAGELQVGDRVIAVGQGVNGSVEDIKHMKLQKIVDLIRGKRNSIVRLRVIPNGKDPSEVSDILIKRGKVDLKESLARAELIDTRDSEGKRLRLGWIDLPSFYSDMDTGQTSVTKDTRRLLDRLMAEGIDGLILDLRENGGGSLEEAINLTGLFIPRGPVVQSRDSREKKDVKISRAPRPVYDGPLVVLTSKSSASASEILAAALQDYNRAVVVGEQSTFGKGTVQQLLPVTTNQFSLLFPGNANQAGALKLTIQKFYRIAGGSTQRKGVLPDIQLPSITDAMDHGEASLKNPLPYDEIERETFALFRKEPFPLDELRQRSAGRVAASEDFNWVQEETERYRQRKEANVISLNKEERLKEIEDQDARREARRELMKRVYTEIKAKEEGLYTTYSLTLDRLDEKGLRLLSDVSAEELSGMMTGPKDETDDEQKALEPPHRMDHVKREALRITRDLIRLLNAKGTSQLTASKVKPVEVTN